MKEIQWVIEWNHLTDTLHIQPLDAMLARNQEHFIRGESRPYSMLMVASLESCYRMQESWKTRIEKRNNDQLDPIHQGQRINHAQDH